jgi:hypothetical protein
MILVLQIISTSGTGLLLKLKNWWETGSDGAWNRLDTFNFAIALIVFILRLTWISRIWPIARALMLLNLVVYFLRLFKIFLVNSYLGPKTVIIAKMASDYDAEDCDINHSLFQMKDLLMFFCFFIVFLLAYSVSSQSLIDNDRQPHWGIFWDILSSGLWEIFGEANEQHMFGR